MSKREFINLRDMRPIHHVGRRVPKNPFDPIPVVEHLEWCRHCEMDVDVQIEAANADGTDVYRKRCKRCGQVMQWGIARRSLNNKDKPISQRAKRFIQETGQDRR
jgi:hypothetical protein